MQEITGVILAAGKASRIYPLNEYAPKALLSVGNKPLILHQIEQMKEVGVRKFYIVVGQLKEHIVNFLKDGNHLGVEVSYVEQKEPLGIAHAVAQVADFIETSFFVFLGDIFMVSKDLDAMVKIYENQQAKAVLAVKEESDPELIRKNFSVTAKENGRVSKVVEKPKGSLNTNLKGCGIYLFDPVVLEAIRFTPRTALRDEYELTHSIQLLIDSAAKVYHAPIIKWDMNITFPDDLLLCNLYYLKMLKKDKLIGDNAMIDPQCDIKNSVLGNNVIIKEGILIKDSLILSDVKIDKAEDIERSVVTSAGKIVCRSDLVI